MSIALYDDFDNALGEFLNYDTYNSAQRTQLAAQKHVDIRSFEQGSIFAPLTMFDMDGLAMSTLDGETMGELETGILFQQGENWSAGTVGPQSDRNNFKGIALTCSTGTNVTASIDRAVDIGDFTATDYISLALPAFPLASINLGSTFLDLTSEPTGNFTTGPTDSLALSASAVALTAGDSEARFPLSLLTTIDRTKITGVRFRIQATAGCTFRCLAIRCLAQSWEFAPIDQNTLYDRLQATVPPSASLTQAHSFPTATAPVTPADWPVLFRSDGGVGPNLVDIEVGAVIATGANTAENTFTLYLRELAMLPESMLTLDGVTMSSLDGLSQMPDYSPGTLDTFVQSHYLTVTMQWGTTAAVHIKDETGAGYDFTGLTFDPNFHYYLLVNLDDSLLRVRVYPISLTGFVDWGALIFDSTAIVDSSFVRRRRGRVGWYAQLQEGDTYVKMLRPRRVVYGEYRSLPFESVTPVEGARIYPDSTPAIELYTGAVATPGAVIGPDVTKSNSGQCIRVMCDGIKPLEGLKTAQPMRFENLYDSEITFDVLAPTSARLTALLRGEGRALLVYLPPIPANRWTHLSAPLFQLGQNFLPGAYTLYILQGETGQNIWYVDHLSVRSRAVAWQGRGQAADPRLVYDPEWIDFGDTINDPNNGALLGRGDALQVRGQALTQDASITGVKLLPQYATLGNFVWTDEAPTYPSLPVACFTAAVAPDDSMTFNFDASCSSAIAGIAAYVWEFGDGIEGAGGAPAHTYTTGGTYTVTMTVVDNLGQKASTTHQVSSRELLPSRIVFTRTLGGVGTFGDICTITPDGGDLTTIVHNPAADYEWVSWSPDGTLLMAADTGSAVGGSPGVWIFDQHGGVVRQLTNLHALANAPFFQGSWSPDGTRVALVASSTPAAGSTVTIQIVNVDNSGFTTFTVNNFTGWAGYGLPWSPDGTKLAYATNAGLGTPSNITTCHIDGTSQTTILTGTTHLQYIPWAWYADSTNLLVGCLGPIGAPAESRILKTDGITTTVLYDDLTSTIYGMENSPISLSPDNASIAWVGGGSYVDSQLYVLAGGTFSSIYDVTSITENLGPIGLSWRR